MSVEQTNSSSVLVNTCRRHRKGMHTCKHSQVTVPATPVLLTHTYILVKGCLQNHGSPLTPLGELIFFSFSCFCFVSPGQVFNLTL